MNGNGVLSKEELEEARSGLLGFYFGKKIDDYVGHLYREDSALRLWLVRFSMGARKLWMITYQGKIIDLYLNTPEQRDTAFAIVESGIQEDELEGLKDL